MTHLFISCNESRIENNKSFYGSFTIGPFEGGESLTIANALRRTLLSQLKGLAIISIQIEGVLHEYSNLPGVKDSVLDILLNLKDIHFYSKLPTQDLALLPQIGYLRVQGPGIVRASDLKLPPFIQLVDPEQYIATLAEDGFINMKFIISLGKNYILQKASFQKEPIQYSRPKVENKKVDSTSLSPVFYSGPFSGASSSKKRRFLLQKINEYFFSSNKELVSPQVFTGSKKGILKNNNYINSALNKNPNFTNSNPLTLDSVFAPVTKVNYIIEYSEHKTIDTSFAYSKEVTELSNFLKPLNNLNSVSKAQTVKKSVSYPLKGRENTKVFKSAYSNSSSLVELLEIKKELSYINGSQEYVKPSSIKHNVIIEIWTNGSLHPREALYQGLKNLVQVFSNLYTAPSILNAGSISMTMSRKETSSLNDKKAIKPKTKKNLQLLKSMSLLPLNTSKFSSNYTVLSTTPYKKQST
uniref:Plastid-encoded RNA polymerase subunit alpha n=1 Tax=Phacotus lenticularis TaxID=52965 RepID=A0A0S2LQS0_9CHLO|nr:alpha subunit of RNA polymerase [Phacotus lenticularis]ALO63610.1 alpha subunit of RNA polymerase [Phacotus lenticularis]